MTKRSLMALLTAMMTLMMMIPTAFAAEPLAYKTGVGAGYEFNKMTLDTEWGPLNGNSHGVQASFTEKHSGFAAKLSVSGIELEGSADNFGSDIGDEMPVVSIELSKRLHQFDDGLQLGIYGKYTRFIGKLKGESVHEHDYYDEDDNYVGTDVDVAKNEVKDLQVTEIGLLLQKDFSCLHLYAGPMIQLIHGNAKDTWIGVYDGDVYEDSWSGDLRQKSTLGFAAGLTFDLGKNLSANVNATIKEHASYGAGLQLNF